MLVETSLLHELAEVPVVKLVQEQEAGSTRDTPREVRDARPQAGSLGPLRPPPDHQNVDGIQRLLVDLKKHGMRASTRGGSYSSLALVQLKLVQPKNGTASI